MSTRMLDLEAQSPPATPVVAYTRSFSTEYRHKRTRNGSDPIGDFFGMTRESRHDRRPFADAPPAYVTDDNDTTLPRYSAVAPEPVTLAMYLFKYGFLFPPFWILGALILFSPLREPSPSPSPFSSRSRPPSSAPSPPPTYVRWMPEKTESERHALILEMQRVEVKWAKRCLLALSIIVCLATGVGVTVRWVLRKPPAAY